MREINLSTSACPLSDSSEARELCPAPAFVRLRPKTLKSSFSASLMESEQVRGSLRGA